MTTSTTYPLRLPKSIKAAAERLSKADGTSLNQFVATAVAEKIAVMETAAFFEERAARARARATRGEPSALLAALARAGGEPPREGDELPEGCEPQATSAAPARQRNAPKPTATRRRAAGKKA
ncbi:MAG: hypothetical protein JNL87_14545 [Burkholderiaceae bacterium]|nr:hypothetical protein [Burkholderiaceae bacterium]